MTDNSREALHRMGLSDDQIDAALAHMGAGPHAAPAEVGFDPFRVEQLERENGIQTGPRSPITAAHMFMSLNGFDEIGIAQAFGAPVGELRRDAVTLARALIFTDARRTVDMKHDDAYKFAMSLTIEEVTGYFAPEPKGEHAASAEGNAESA